MVSKTIHLLIVLSAMMGMVVLPRPSTVIGQPSPPPPEVQISTENDSAELLAEPVEVLSGDNNYFLKIDLDDPRVHPKVILANNDNGGLQTLYGMKRRFQEYEHWAIINGDLFSRDCPGGVNCAQGLTYIDRQPQNNWFKYGDTWRVRGNIGFDSSNNVQISIGDGQSKRYMTIAGGPRILINGGTPTCYSEPDGPCGLGKTYFPYSGECFEKASYWCSDTRAITMIGYSADGRYLYMGISKGGKTPVELAQWLKEHGAREILRFDSGSSTGMYYNDSFVGGTGSKPIANAFAIVVDDSSPQLSCQAPNLISPNNDYVVLDQFVTFRWNGDDVHCDNDAWRIRVKTVPDMDSGGETIVDSRTTQYEKTVTFDSEWDDRDLYWSVRASGASVDEEWASSRVFHLSFNDPPTISFNTANGDSFPSGVIESREQNWTFQGTASDPDGSIESIKYYCEGDGCGEYYHQTGLESWLYEQHNLQGRNEIYFRAKDNDGAKEYSRHLDLIIDLAAPYTTLALNNETDAGRWPEWFNEPVEVRLQTVDGNTGNARVGVQALHYRLDGGDWQVHSDTDVKFSVSEDGIHSIEYYAVDRLGNTESQKQISFNIDTTPPTTPGTIMETHGVMTGQWQKNWNDPAFTWDASSDATSGIHYYLIEWDETQHFVTTPAFDPLAVRTGSYNLRVRAVDRAGNISSESAEFTFNYDGTPPSAPDIQNNDGIFSGLWQNKVRTPDFSWAVPNDEGSGVLGYNLYWGPNIAGTSDTLYPHTAFSDTTPICADDEAATAFLRLRSLDNVGWASEWVGYALRYDGAPPTATLTANYGLTTAHQIDIHLGLQAYDTGSGVSKMRLSLEGQEWTDWQDFTTETYMQIPAVGRRSYTFYLQVQDAAGNVSQVVSDTVYFDVNVPHPRSETFRLWNSLVSAGSNTVTSTSYALRATVGQPSDTPILQSTQHILSSGFYAGSLAIPTVIPTYTRYMQAGSLFASATTSATALASTEYQLYGSLGQPSDMQTVSSANYVAALGFWSGGGIITKSEIITPTIPPTITIPLTPTCEFYSISINDGALFTNSPLVSLNLCGPDPVEMLISNDGGFGDATWQPYTDTVPWALTTYGNYVLPRFVYARYRDSSDVIHGVFFDDIIYDPTAPTGQAAFDIADLLDANKIQHTPFALGRALAQRHSLRMVQESTVNLYLSVADDNSGIGEIQISKTPDFAGTTWQPYSAVVPVTFEEEGLQTIYVRTSDQAGNVSNTIADSLIVDTIPPVGTVQVLERGLSSEAISVTLMLLATDNATSVAEVRVSSSESFASALWQAYTPQLSVPISYTGDLNPVLYLQFRDGAGNVSSVYSTTYLIDTAPPWMLVEVSPGDTLTRTLTILAYDELSGIDELRLSNDPMMWDDVVYMPYQPTLTWGFDVRQVVWVQLIDHAGNRTEPYPAYARMPEPPFIPSNPVPPDGAFGVPTDQILVWQGGDPDDDPVLYTVALGTENPPPVVATDLSFANYAPGALLTNTTYYWAITATDGISNTVGPIWSFTTTTTAPANHAPYMPRNPVPANGEVDVSIEQLLSWYGGDPDGCVVTYTVTMSRPLGTMTIFLPPVITTSVTAHYNPGLLAPYTDYVWYVTATDGLSTTVGELWSFMTGAGYEEDLTIYLPLVLRNW